MNTKTYDQETPDVLARWWWPGQWLRIVWSVWVDQKWYWQNVYPRLENRRRGWGIFVQTWLGAMLIALCLLVIRSIIVGGLGMETIKSGFTLIRLGRLLGYFTLVAFGIKLLFGTVVGVPFSALYIVVLAVYTLCYVFTVDIERSWPVLFVLYLMLGFSFGVFQTVSKGYMEWGEVFIGAVCISAVNDITIITPNWFLLRLSKFAFAFILGGAAMYAGARWARRDLTEEMAERLKKRGKADA